MRKRLGCVLAAAGWAAAAERPLEARFREPPPSVRGPSAVVRVADAQEVDEALGRVGRLAAMGAGGVLLEMPQGGGPVWPALEAVAARCRALGLELGVSDFVQEGERVPLARRLVWSSREVAATGLSTNMTPLVFGPGPGYREEACLAWPAGGPVLPSQPVDVRRGPLPAEGMWRVWWFGSVAVEPPLPDPFDRAAGLGHVNQMLVALQGRLVREYGTTLLWCQFAGFGEGALPWPEDVREAFVARSGLGLAGCLPALAGVEVGDAATAAYVRRQMAETVREAWRERYARVIGDLVQEAGLEAGLEVCGAPAEPEEVAWAFRRPTLRPACGEAERLRNRRAAGAARVMARRVVVGRLAPVGGTAAAEAALLPFAFRPEADGLFADGVTRLLLEGGDGVWERASAFEEGRVACRYARRCQGVLSAGEPAADFLVSCAGPVPELEGYSCDFASRAMLGGATVRDGALRFESERTYRALVVGAAELADEAWAERARRWAGRGVAVWAAGGTDAALPAGVRRLTRGADGLPLPDFEWTAEAAGVALRFLHRRTEDEEVYFIVNTGAGAGPVTGTFRDVGGGVAERWDPLSGEVAVLGEVRRRPDGRLDVAFVLEPYGACFVVFAR